MKLHRLSAFFSITLIATVAGLMTGCASTRYYDPNPYYTPRMAYYDFWYYPAIGAYYDPRARTYIYYEHDHWIHARALPPRIRPYLGSHVTVRSPHDRPYEEHHRHRYQYLPEKYRKSKQIKRADDAWIGSPRKLGPQRNHDEHNKKRDVRHRNDKDLRHEPGKVPVKPDYRESGIKYPRQVPNIRPNDTPRHHEPPRISRPVKREDNQRHLEIHKEQSREQYRSGEDRRNNKPKKDHDKSATSTRQSGRYRTPDSRVQGPKTPPKAAPGHREPPSQTVPAKQDKQGHQQENRKTGTQHRKREGDEGLGNQQNDDDAASRKRQRSPFYRYEQYRP